ncbi:MAG: HlyC/CorC family transporter [Ignavibacteriales bacterium CG_4_9_14_3_um_filter_30_11]|nr:MAG: HlyC/CorC family transporter [Ignavibacteriales bacterium CG_4_9_14_3_um_filter_30_11]
MILELIILVILILLSGFFSGSEIAYVVANKVKIEIRANQKNLSTKNTQFFSKNPQYFFSTVLIGTNVINVAYASMSAIFLYEIFGLSELNILLISTFVLLIFGELLPKYIASEMADSVIFLCTTPLRIISYFIHPLVVLLSKISSFFTKRAVRSEKRLQNLFNKENFEYLINESKIAGVIDQKQSDIIGKVFDLSEQRVYEAMQPRTEIAGVEINSTFDEIITTFIESGYSKLPVYEENLDNIKGIILAYDIFNKPDNLKSIIREVAFVPETKNSFEMLNEFLSKQMSFAVVVDEFGGTAGIVTMEDLIEELFGEIKDEYDVDDDICRKIGEGTFLISGKVEVDYINEKYKLKIPEGDYETIGGYILAKVGKIPEPMEKFDIDNFEVLIVKADHLRVDVIKLIVKEVIN